MTEKRFVMYEHKDNDYILDAPNTSLDFIEMLGDALSSEEIVDRLNEQDERILELEKEVLDLRAEVGRLNSKKEIETPHWLKYESSKGYTKKVNQDIRFNGDVE